MLISFITISILVFLDQYSKFLVENQFSEPFELIPGFLELHYSQNTGIAFSLFESFPFFLTVLNSIIVTIFIIYFLKNQKTSFVQNIGSILIISGGIGNLLDRYMRGYVVDFINPSFMDFAIFNLADCFLNIGVLILIMEVFSAKQRN